MYKLTTITRSRDKNCAAFTGRNVHCLLGTCFILGVTNAAVLYFIFCKIWRYAGILITEHAPWSTMPVYLCVVSTSSTCFFLSFRFLSRKISLYIHFIFISNNYSLCYFNFSSSLLSISYFFSFSWKSCSFLSAF